MDETKTAHDWTHALGVREFPEDRGEGRRNLAFLGYFPCPVRGGIRDMLERMLEERFAPEPGGSGSVPWFVPSGCGGEDAYEGLWEETDAARLPEVILSLDYGDFWRRGFRERFVDGGLFAPVGPPRYQDSFARAGIAPHPLGYSFFAAFPTIILADLDKVGDRPLPESWSDLWNPMWEQDICMMGHEPEVGMALPMWIGKHHGGEGIRALSRNVRTLCHPAHMAKLAGSGNPGGCALYVLNWFFADSCARQDKVRLLVPREGALVTPLYILAKKNRSPAARAFVETLYSPEVAAVCREKWFPPVVETHVPGEPDRSALESCRFAWLGWDFVLGQDYHALKDAWEALFLKDWKGGFA